jgi:hypothetical protein
MVDKRWFGGGEESGALVGVKVCGCGAKSSLWGDYSKPFIVSKSFRKASSCA